MTGPGESPKNGQMGKKVIDRMLTSEVKDRCLWVRFEGGPTASWQLPERWRAVVGTILFKAKSFAIENGATLDQINDIEKALRIAGYS